MCGRFTYRLTWREIVAQWRTMRLALPGASENGIVVIVSMTPGVTDAMSM
jgi:hypothetical protein